MSLRFYPSIVVTSNHRRTRITLLDPSRPQCDNCAEDVWESGVVGVVHGDDVVVCSERCWARLQTVWAPTHRRLPWREGVRAVALGIAFYLML